MAINNYFKMRCVLNNLDLNKPIYKYIPFKYVLNMIKTQKLYICEVKQWKDTYENFLLKQKFKYKNITLKADNVIDHIYGQCWTSLNESDAMWRIYSSPLNIDDTAIKIKTTAQKLFDSIYISDECMATTSIGVVKYYYKKDLLQWIKSLHLHTAQDIGDNIVPSMYMKRKPFSHEKEIRIIIMLDTNIGEILKYDINPDNFFEEFVIDPRLEKNHVNIITKKLINLGVKESLIKQSQLYTFTPEIIRL